MDKYILWQMILLIKIKIVKKVGKKQNTQKLSIQPERSVHALHPILQTTMMSLRLNMSERTPPKMPQIEKVIVNASPAK